MSLWEKRSQTTVAGTDYHKDLTFPTISRYPHLPYAVLKSLLTISPNASSAVSVEVDEMGTRTVTVRPYTDVTTVIKGSSGGHTLTTSVIFITLRSVVVKYLVVVPPGERSIGSSGARVATYVSRSMGREEVEKLLWLRKLVDTVRTCVLSDEVLSDENQAHHTRNTTADTTDAASDGAADGAYHTLPLPVYNKPPTYPTVSPIDASDVVVFHDETCSYRAKYPLNYTAVRERVVTEGGKVIVECCIEGGGENTGVTVTGCIASDAVTAAFSCGSGSLVMSPNLNTGRESRVYHVAALRYLGEEFKCLEAVVRGFTEQWDRGEATKVAKGGGGEGFGSEQVATGDARGCAVEPVTVINAMGKFTDSGGSVHVLFHDRAMMTLQVRAALESANIIVTPPPCFERHDGRECEKTRYLWTNR